MSWDISLIKFKNPEQKEFTEDAHPFLVSEVVSALKSNIANIEIDDYWCVIDNDMYNVSFDLTPTDGTIDFIMLFASINDDGEESFMSFLNSLCHILNCNAIDMCDNKLIC